MPNSAINGYEKKSLVYSEINYGRYENNKTVVTTFHEPMKNL